MKTWRDPWRIGRIAVQASVGLVLAFLVLPLIVVVATAFNNSAYIQFPPRQWSLRWFNEYLGSARWISATEMSLELGAVVAICATLMGRRRRAPV